MRVSTCKIDYLKFLSRCKSNRAHRCIFSPSPKFKQKLAQKSRWFILTQTPSFAITCGVEKSVCLEGCARSEGWYVTPHCGLPSLQPHLIESMTSAYPHINLPSSSLSAITIDCHRFPSMQSGLTTKPCVHRLHCTLTNRSTTSSRPQPQTLHISSSRCMSDGSTQQAPDKKIYSSCRRHPDRNVFAAPNL